jgi:hypothetical protein
VSDGPTYAFDIGAARVAHLRFLAFHGCGTRFTVMYREMDDDTTHGDGNPAEAAIAATAALRVGFDVGELESARRGKGKGKTKGKGASGPDGPWRVRLAGVGSTESDGDGGGGGDGGGTQQQQRVIVLAPLAHLSGADMAQLALFDDDLGARRLYHAEPHPAAAWSAARAAPRWPKKLLDTLDATGGVCGDDALVCVDGKYFVELIELSAFPTPVLFPHGAWRLKGLGPGLPDFHAAAAAVQGVDAVTALRALAAATATASSANSSPSPASAVDVRTDEQAERRGDGVEVTASSSSSGGGYGDTAHSEASGRLTGELPGRGRIQLGGSGGVAGVGRALEAVTHREVRVTFPSGPLGLGFAPLDWDLGKGAQVWEVDQGSNAARAGVTPGMVFTSVGGEDVTEADFAGIDALFDGPRPLTVTFNTFVPGAERLYAVEMVAKDVLEALQQRIGAGGEAGNAPDGDGDEAGDIAAAGEGNVRGEGNADEASAASSFSRVYFSSLFEEPAGVFEESPAVVWREEPSTLFVGDPGSATVVHHDIIGQIELCHVLSGAKLLAAAPWGASSQDLLAKAGGGGKRRGNDDGDCDSAATKGGDVDEGGDGEEEEGSVLGVPVHRKLHEAERALLSHRGLSVVHARPGDAVAFSSAATHFATNGCNGPCAAVFHGVLTPASVHVLAAHPARLDPFTEEERKTEGFDGHLTGRMVLQELVPTGKQVLKATTAAAAKAADRLESGKRKKPAKRSLGGGGDVSPMPRLTAHERGVAGEAAARRRFEEAVRRMDQAVNVSKKTKTKNKGVTPNPAPPLWGGASFTSFYVDDSDGPNTA